LYLGIADITSSTSVARKMVDPIRGHPASIEVKCRSIH
jgi:hypothetical protein